MRTRPWELSDDQWEHFGPLIPERPGRDPNKEYQRKPGGGRRAADPRRTLEGILYVLRTGCQWNAVPRCYGGSATIHRYFQRWARAGFFLAASKTGLMTLVDLDEIDWEWQSIDGARKGQRKNASPATKREDGWSKSATRGSIGFASY